MHTPCGRLALAGLLLVLAAWPRAARAQHEPSTDTTMPRRPIAAWASVGLGSGRVHGPAYDSPLAGVLGLHASVGRLLFTLRGSEVGPFLNGGDGVSETALLVGARTGGRRLFASGTLGIGRARHYYEPPCDMCNQRSVDPAVGVLAYDVALHANAYVPGLAVALSGNVGPRPARYAALTVALELGWFGW